MPKRVAATNAKRIAHWKPDPDRTLEIVDGAVPGLRVRLSPSGVMSWSLSARIDGRRRRVGIGEGLPLDSNREPTKSVYLRMHAPNLGGGDIVLSR